MRMRAGAGTVALGAAAVALLSGCTEQVVAACPELGWVNTVEVQLQGDPGVMDLVTEVRACDDAGCSTPLVHPLGRRMRDSMVILPTQVPSESSAWSSSASGTQTWIVDVRMSTPHEIDVQARDAGGEVLGEVTAEPVWIRVGGSPVCGGPAVTDAVVVPVALPEG